MQLNIGEHSLAFLRAVQDAEIELQSLETAYDDAVMYTEKEARSPFPAKNGYYPYHITFISINRTLPFYFEIKSIKDLGKGVIDYMAVWKPSSETSAKESATNGDLEVLKSQFNEWAQLVRQYNSIHLSRKDRFTQQAAEEFFADFELAEDDADTAPFDNDKQFVLYKLLDYIKQKVEQQEGADQAQADAIVSEIKLLQASIPVVTKATAIKGLSRIFAKTKAFSIKLMADFFDVAKKEALKAALYGGLHEADTFFHSIHILP